ncbi:magnesium and cobalt transporter [Spirochaetota bacterium]|nr:magnesium and cobalt transporter [Spirochaetota bacterium]
MIDDWPVSLELVLGVALAFSAFSSASEAAYLSLDRIAINRLERSRDLLSRGTHFLRKRLSSLIITLLLLNMFANIVATVVSVRLLDQFLAQEPFYLAAVFDIKRYVLVGEILFLVLFSLVLIIFCEFFPKWLAVYYAMAYSRAVALVLLPIYTVLMPITLPVAWMIRWVISRIQFPLAPEVPRLASSAPAVPVHYTNKTPARTASTLSPGKITQPKNTSKNLLAKGITTIAPKGEVKSSQQRASLDDEYFFRIPFDREQFLNYAHLSSHAGVLKKVELGLLKNFVQYKNMEVRQFMIPRDRIKGIDLSKKRSIESLKKTIRHFPFKYIPFYRVQKDSIEGVLSQEKCALSMHGLDFKTHQELRRNLEKPITILTTKNILAALDDIRNSASEVALVSDEYGGIEGIVTYDDIIYRFFGRVPGTEHNNDQKTLIKSVGKGFFRVPGTTPLSDINEHFAINMSSETVETLGGYLLEHFKRIPKRYETFNDLYFEYTVQECTQKGISVVILKRVSS